MGELRLAPESQHVLEEWWNSHRPKEGDRELICELLRTIVDGTWNSRWHSTKDLADDQPTLPVVTIQPRENLAVLIRFWPADDPPEFDLIAIVDLADLPEHD
ncbi:hypothetical protein [Sphaerisporangium dianthi]|uniref:Uncharacterized protein n=1 Tax=Sphaerisporangium dianthi TaxID=1436120 RepID=A0ABV9CV51_9ACTN